MCNWLRPVPVRFELEEAVQLIAGHDVADAERVCRARNRLCDLLATSRALQKVPCVVDCELEKVL